MLSKQTFLRVAGATLFMVGGGWFVLLSLIANSLLPAPSFWYIPCFWVLIPMGLLWCWRPSLAAALSIGPLVGVAASIRCQSGIWAVLWAGCLIVAAVLIFIALREDRRWKKPMVASFAFLLVAFCTDLLFTNRVTIKTLQMVVVPDAALRWNGINWQGSLMSVVLYRPVGTNNCSFALDAERMPEHLLTKRMIPVEFTIFSDFGHERTYKVRSIDGILLKDGNYVITPDDRDDGCPLLLFRQPPGSQRPAEPMFDNVPDSCPVTKPSAMPFVPPAPFAWKPEPGSFWYGSVELWTELPDSGAWTNFPINDATPSRSYRKWVQWGRRVYVPHSKPQPELEVTAKRLDSPAPAPAGVRISSESMFDGPQSPLLIWSAVDLPTLGCWELTGQYGDNKLTFVVWVADSPKPHFSLLTP